MRSLVYFLLSPVLHAAACVIAILYVTVSFIFGPLVPKARPTAANGTLEHPVQNNEEGGGRNPAEAAEARQAGRELQVEMARSPTIKKDRPEQAHFSQCKPCPLKTLNDLRDWRLAYDMMAELAVTAAEEHVGRHARDAGLVAVYAQRAAKYLARLRLLVGDELTDLVAHKPWLVPHMAQLETQHAGRIVPDGPTARAAAAVDALNHVEEAIAIAQLFDEEAMRKLQPAPEAEPGQAPVKRRLSYTDEQQGVLPSHTDGRV